MDRNLLADWASEAERLYRGVRRSAFIVGVVITVTAVLAFSWPGGWVIAVILAVVVARSLLAPNGRIEVDIVIDAIALGLTSWIVDVPAGWIILAFPVAFAALFGRLKLAGAVSVISLFFGLAPRVAPTLFNLTDATWVPDFVSIELVDDSTGRGLASGVLIVFLLIVIAMISRRMRTIERTRAQSLASVAHDLRNTAGAVQGLSVALLDEELSRGGRELAMGLLESANENLQLTDDLLALSRFYLEPAGGEINPFDLAALVRRTLANRPDIQVTTPAEVWALGDRGRTAQVLRNLVANATLHGAPPFEVIVHATKGLVSTSVVDCGTGVSAEVERTLFTPSSSSKDGLGIGLATSLSFAEHMGGTLTHRREPDRTIFTLALPRVIPPTMPVDAAPRSESTAT
ncbi:MAG: HAMP domain-containing histidine kinase [Acidimicrobiia bacterium]|nr:HAMP domain-containing histidine kinase [Acidimicrobiia bacterium]